MNHCILPQLSSSADIDVNLADAEGGTALHHAAQSGHVAVVERLLRAPGVDARKVKPGAGTPLQLAAAGGKLLVADLLLAHESGAAAGEAVTAPPDSLKGVVSHVVAGVPPPGVQFNRIFCVQESVPEPVPSHFETCLNLLCPR